MEEFVNVFELLEEVSKETNEMDDVWFGAFLCMLAEEHCKATNQDVQDFMRNLINVVDQVNDELGRY